MINRIYDNIDLKLVGIDYFDYYLVTDKLDVDNRNLSDCEAVYFDFNNVNIYPNSGDTTTIKSLHKWNNFTNTGYTLDTIGLTAFDNGLLLYDKEVDDYSNLKLLELITGSTLNIESNVGELIMNNISGSTNNYIYPTTLTFDETLNKNVMEFCGGFYQGFFKLDGTNYEVLPTRTNKGWVADFVLNKTEICNNTGNTLNNLHPNNKGLFFYMGVRSENKYWNQFEGNNIELCSPTGSTEFCTDIKESDIELYDEVSGFNIFLNPPQLNVREIKNQFLIYGRASNSSKCRRCGGDIEISGFGKQDTCSFEQGSSLFVSDFKRKKIESTNQFLIYGRANNSSKCRRCGTISEEGYGTKTTCDTDNQGEIITELDKEKDLINNALGFLIKDDGSIGYRTIIKTCEEDENGIIITGITIEEKFSEPNLINEDTWNRITIRYVSNDYYSDEDLLCKKPRKGKYMIYVNCLLKHIFEDVDEFIPTRLDEFYKKQYGVPYNISIGGGTQGLLENMTFDGQDNDDIGLFIEKNFAGSFIGKISEFKFDICDLDWTIIRQRCGLPIC